MRSLSRAMGYHPPRAMGFRNHAPDGLSEHTALSAADIAILREYNGLDLQLYSYACRLSLERNDPAVCLDQILEAVCGGSTYKCPPGSFDLDLAQPIPGSGWYPPEFHGDTPVRWTGPMAFATLELPLDRRTAYACIMRFSVPEPDLLNGMVVTLDGDPVEVEMELEGKSAALSFLIPRGEEDALGPYTEIIFRFSRAMIPAEHGGVDLRALGVLVTSVSFTEYVEEPEQAADVALARDSGMVY
jgi:hypothetical protein